MPFRRSTPVLLVAAAALALGACGGSKSGTTVTVTRTVHTVPTTAASTVASSTTTAAPASQVDERVAILDAALRGQPAKRRCIGVDKVTVSKVDATYALVDENTGCGGGGNGMSLMHKTANGWTSTFSGSEPPTCDNPPAPGPVVKELFGTCFVKQGDTVVSGSGNPLAGSAATAAKLVAARGYSVPDVSSWDQTRHLNVLLGIPRGSADSHNNLAFFFLDGKLLGTDTKGPSGSLAYKGRSGETIALEYGVYATGDPLCCPSTHKVVHFRMVGGRLTPQEQIPAKRG